MRSFRIFAVWTVLAVFTAPSLLAAEFGVRAGRHNDSREEFVGAEMAFGSSVVFNPNIEYWLNSDVTVLSGNADLLFQFGRGTFQPYVGGGLGVLYSDNVFGSTSDPLFNLIGGIRFNLDILKPYAQVKYFRLFESGGGDDIAITVGMRF
ncbi:MAG TPA: hypothetical protein VNA04_00055 [Thermoanaerobaculia bacterium]|nr:hypothetical protein [Thermoanaerobaculia bacterium]